MNIKTLLLLIFILALIASVLGFVTMTNTPDVELEITVLDPVSFTQDSATPINLITQNIQGYEYVTISDDDTIILYNRTAAQVIINLERRAWKNISWSPDGRLISVLGKTRDNIYDIYIFQVQSKTWVRATNFTPLGVGVDSYAWKGAMEITFTQGQGNDRWIHSYNHESGSVLKIAKTPGNILNYSKALTYLLVEVPENNEKTYPIHNNLGNKILELNFFLDQSNVDIRKTITEIFAVTDNGKIVMNLDGNIFAKADLGSLTAAFMDIEESSYNFICTVNEDELYFANVENEEIKLNILNTKRERMGSEAKKNIGGGFKVTENSDCFGERDAIFSVQKDNKIKWFEYRFGTNSLVEMLHLENSKEVNVI